MPDAPPPGFVQHGHRDSRALTWAFVPAILFCVPLLPLLGLVLGIVGAVRGRRDDTSGPFVAVIVVAAVCTALQGVLLVGVVLPGTHHHDTSTADRDRSGQVVRSGDVDVRDLRQGDCFTDADEPYAVPGTGFATIDDVVVQPCAKEHSYEVFREYPVPGDTYPGEGPLGRDAETGCARSFATFVGLPERRSVLDHTVLVPSATSWKADPDRRDVLCVVYDPQRFVDGTLRGADR